MSGPALLRTAPVHAEWKRIPEALRSLWRACLPDQQGADVARSLAINFVAVAAAAEEDALRETVDKLVRRTPCRAFLLLLDPAARPGTATLAATTRTHGALRDIVLEEIAVRLPASAMPQITGLVRPLLENDLPNHLYWATRLPADESTLDALASMCDHLIVDSKRFGAVARELDAVQQRRRRGHRVTDLTWLRLRPWRRALAEAFDRFPWQPGAPVTGTIRHGGNGLAAAQLLANWLQARTQAKVALDPTGGPTALCPERVALAVAGCDIELTTGGPQVRVSVSTPERCDLPFHVPQSRGTDGDLVGAAVDLG
ncbi:MAG: glucose-6-phosphate dehydrogenase assembly protein OpcA [Phycisphaerales bacterium]|nr:glucose-6-phosphate dehydrogenase assembly protein OpcA [Phycisphaerales bacterium]